MRMSGKHFNKRISPMNGDHESTGRSSGEPASPMTNSPWSKDNATPSPCCGSRRLFPRWPSSAEEIAEKSSATLPDGNDSSNGVNTSPTSNTGSEAELDAISREHWRPIIRRMCIDLLTMTDNPHAERRNVVERISEAASCF